MGLSGADPWSKSSNWISLLDELQLGTTGQDLNLLLDITPNSLFFLYPL